MRILIVKLTSMGDVLHVLPALTDAAQHIPNLQVDWVVEESFAEIPAWHPTVNKVIPVATRRWRKLPGGVLSEVRQCYRELREQEYDLIIDAQGLIKSALISKLAKGKVAGFCEASVKEKPASWFYDRKCSVLGENGNKLHAVAKLRQLFAQALGYELQDDAEIQYDIEQAIEETHSLEFFARPYMVFLHGTTWATKHLPEQQWYELADLAAKNGYQVMLPWGNASEKQRAKRIALTNESVRVLPRMTLSELANVLHQAEAVIAVDTGLGHLSAALSTPCLSVYGATDHELTGAVGQNQLHLQADYRCSPCLLKQCNLITDSIKTPPCYATISSEFIWKLVNKIKESK